MLYDLSEPTKPCFMVRTIKTTSIFPLRVECPGPMRHVLVNNDPGYWRCQACNAVEDYEALQHEE